MAPDAGSRGPWRGRGGIQINVANHMSFYWQVCLFPPLTLVSPTHSPRPLPPRRAEEGAYILLRVSGNAFTARLSRLLLRGKSGAEPVVRGTKLGSAPPAGRCAQRRDRATALGAAIALPALGTRPLVLPEPTQISTFPGFSGRENARSNEAPPFRPGGGGKGAGGIGGKQSPVSCPMTSNRTP